MAKDDRKADDISKLSFEQAIQQLEKGQVPLEESIAFYEKGTALKAHCEAKLRDAEARIEKIVIGPGGNATLAPLDAKS